MITSVLWTGPHQPEAEEGLPAPVDRHLNLTSSSCCRKPPHSRKLLHYPFCVCSPWDHARGIICDFGFRQCLKQASFLKREKVREWNYAGQQSAEDEPARQEVNKCRERRRVARSGVQIWKHIPSSLDQFQSSSAADWAGQTVSESAVLSDASQVGSFVEHLSLPSGLVCQVSRHTSHTETEKHLSDLYHYDTGRLAWGELPISSTAWGKVNRGTLPECWQVC